MKFFRYVIFSALFLTGMSSCTEESGNRWNIELKDDAPPVKITDISAEFYNPEVSLQKFTAEYPWFQGTVPDEDFAERRKDSTEISVYRESVSKINRAKLEKDLGQLFAHIQHYFPSFKKPKVFLYSSALQSIMSPVIYDAEQGMLFIDTTAFMGENNLHYKGLEQYFQKSMNPQNIIPKVSYTIAEYFVEPNLNQQKFIDYLIYYGKLMTLQDAFLPGEPDALKMNYTPQEYEWAQANEANIWNYFVENDLVFSSDPNLQERFLKPGPFSKFYTEIDNESSPMVGIFSGWQICRKFYSENRDTALQDFLNMNAEQIFNQSNYKPKNQ